MSDTVQTRPKLRPVEAIPVPGEQGTFSLRDPSGVADQGMTVSESALFILASFDGTRTLDEVAGLFHERYGQPVGLDTLEQMVDKLREGLLLDGPEFREHVARELREYQALAARPSIYGRELGTREEVAALLADMIPLTNGERTVEGHVVGLVAPHLDYPRGWPCYAEAYGTLRGRKTPARVCVLGTNHFGAGTSVVATGKAFETPLGVTDVDTDFIERVSRGCDYDLCEHELDHRREHSIEIQVMCLQHLFGPDSFKLVPFLCPDPCGPTGTKPYDGRGVDLRKFADALGETMSADGADTLLVAGADLSHVGSQFGDDFELDEAYLRQVEAGDRSALERLADSEPDGFVKMLAGAGNETRVCSAGCMFVVGHILRDAKPAILRYHQAHTPEQQICVSCAAMVYTR